MSNETYPEMRPYRGEVYEVVNPAIADNCDFAERWERVILYHGGVCRFRQAELRIAPRGLLCSGWVIGLNPILDPAQSDDTKLAPHLEIAPW